MKTPRVISQLIEKKMSFDECFLNEAKSFGIECQHANVLLKVIPSNIRNSACFLDKMTKLWRYDFGFPFDRLPGDHIYIGTHMFIPIKNLLNVIYIGQQRLEKEQLDFFLHRLSIEKKHFDALAEFMPVVKIPLSTKCKFEVKGYGEGDHTIDWLIEPDGGCPVLIDVKHRYIDLLKTLEDLASGGLKAVDTIDVPKHDASVLFRSLEKKFRECKTMNPIQGVWIHTSVKQENRSLKNAYKNLNNDRIHFAVLGDWHDDVSIIARDDLDPNLIACLLNKKLSIRFIFNADDSF